MSDNTPLLNWVDIQVNDLNRAIDFYEKVLMLPVQLEQFDGFEFAVFGRLDGQGGCLIPSKDPVSSGTHLLYFNVHGRIREALALVPELGGKIEQELHPIGPYGLRAIIFDSEGNRFALHSSLDS